MSEIKTYQHKDLLNRLDEMQRIPYYAPARRDLANAEMAIVFLEKERNELRAALADREAKLAAQAEFRAIAVQHANVTANEAIRYQETIRELRAKLAAQEPFDDWPEYHSEAMGCGLEDRNIRDRYEAMLYGWDKALDQVAERLEGYTAAGAAPIKQWPKEQQPDGSINEVDPGDMAVGAAPVPEGWQLVPVEPTDEMQIRGSEAVHDAGVHSDDTAFDCDVAIAAYKAMLAAATKEPT